MGGLGQGLGLRAPLLHLPSWPLPASSRQGMGSLLWVSRQGWAPQGWGSSRAALCVCRRSPAGLGSWLRTSSQTAPQSSESQQGRLSPEGWRAGQGPGGSRVGREWGVGRG